MKKHTTSINERARSILEISRDEYALCSYIQYRSSDPRGKASGWCTDNKAETAEFVGISRQGLHKMIAKLVEIRLLETSSKGFQRVTGKWIDTESECKQGLHGGVNKVDTKRKQSLHQRVNKVDEVYKELDNKLEEGEREGEQQTPTPETFDEMMERVNAETRDVEEKEKGKAPQVAAAPPTIFSGFREVYDYFEENNPGIFDEPYAPTHAITTVEKTAVPGTITKIVEGINLEPTNPNATTALFNRMNLTPQATNGDEADAILTKWAAENIETVKFKYARAKRKFTPEDLDRLIVKFCGQYASNKDTGTRERFLYDPARFFNDKLSAWLADQPGFEKMLEPKNGFTQPETKSNLPKSIRRY